MAKKAAKTTGESGTNKSEAIRTYMRDNPSAGPTEIAKALNEREGWKISPAYVSTIKNKTRGKKTAGRRGRRPGRPVGTVSRASSGGGSAVNESALLQAKELVQQVGGIDQAKAALDLLGRLTS